MYQTILYKYSSKSHFISNGCKLFSNLDDTGSFFILFNNIYDRYGNLETHLFDIIDTALNLNFTYVNTIIFPIKTDSSYFLKRNISYIIWFVKNSQKMIFNKDPIREKHIWKDVEWGKRKGNYNPKGKDPGNVWIPTIDDGEGHITEHLLMPVEEVINRCILSTHKDNGTIYIDIPKIKRSKIINTKKIVFANTVHKERTYQYQDTIISNNKDTSKIEQPNLTAKIYFSTSENMSALEDNSIDLMLTSPPYWDLKNYLKAGQIGQESYKAYLNRINEVWKETYRVLKSNGSIWININIRIKNKKPVLLPTDIIRQCGDIGYILKDIFIWHKSSGIPTGKNNIVDRFEFLLWFTKSSDYKLRKIKIEDYRNKYINQGIVWNINRKAGSVGKNYIHPAIYPVELVNRIVKLCSLPGDTVLDPFLGSGTTMIGALNNNREFVGYEFNENFINLIKYRAEREIKNKKSWIQYLTTEEI